MLCGSFFLVSPLRKAEEGAPEGPPSEHWPEEELDPKDVALLAGRPEVGSRYAWVDYGTRRAALEQSADELYVVIRDFFEAEAKKLARQLRRRQPLKAPSEDEIRRAVDEAIEQYDWTSWSDVLRPQLEPVLEEAFRRGARNTWEALRQAGVSLQWDLVSPRAKEYAISRAAELVGKHVLPDGTVVDAVDPKFRIDAVTRDLMRRDLAKWIAEGRGWREIADLVERRRYTGFFPDWRARRIARTEAAFADNAGNLAGYRWAGVEKVRVVDGVVDAPCREANGQVWDITYAEAHRLAHPHCARQFIALTDSVKPLQRETKEIAEKATGPRDFTTIEEAEAWARERYPHIEWSLEGAVPETINPTLKEFDRLAREWPQVVERLNSVTVGEFLMYPRAYALVTRDGTKLKFNKAWYGDAQTYLRQLQMDEETGWHPKGTGRPEGVLAHEFGHLVMIYLLEESEGKAFLPAVSPDGTGLVKETVRRFTEEVKATEALSRYALTNAEEAWAEGFSYLRSGRGRGPEYTQRQKALLEAVHPSKWLGPGAWKWTNDIEDAGERARAREAIREFKGKVGLR